MRQIDLRQCMNVDSANVARLFHSILRTSMACTGQVAVVFLIGSLGASWLLLYLAGGIESVAPHFYYLPVLFAAVRFGAHGACLVAVLSGLLAGPLAMTSPDNIENQELTLWLSRTLFFIGIGQIVAWTVRPTLRSITEEVNRLREEEEIRHGILRREFYLLYQPIFSLETNRFFGVEVLARWRQPSGKQVSPKVFVPIAERSGLIHELSAYILREACFQAMKWHRLREQKHLDHWHISVNLSGRDLDRSDLAIQVKRVLDETGLPPAYLQIEITESELPRKGAGKQLRQLKNLGVRIAIDDFGTGFSSLSYLHRFPVDILKIDRTLISELGPRKSDQALAHGIVQLAHSMGLQTIAEGLETEDQVRIGRDLKFDYVQGYYYEKPLPADEIPKQMMVGLPYHEQSLDGQD